MNEFSVAVACERLVGVRCSEERIVILRLRRVMKFAVSIKFLRTASPKQHSRHSENYTSDISRVCHYVYSFDVYLTSLPVIRSIDLQLRMTRL